MICNKLLITSRDVCNGKSMFWNYDSGNYWKNWNRWTFYLDIYCTVVSYESENFSLKWELSACCHPPSISLLFWWKEGARQVSLILMKNSHFDRTLRYQLCIQCQYFFRKQWFEVCSYVVVKAKSHLLFYYVTLFTCRRQGYTIFFRSLETCYKLKLPLNYTYW